MIPKVRENVQDRVIRPITEAVNKAIQALNYFVFRDDSVDLRSGKEFRIFDSTNTDNASLSHDGTDFNFAGTNTTDLNFTGFTNVNIGGSPIPSGTLPGEYGGIEIVTSLPALPDANYPEGVIVFLTTDDKLYRSTGSAWTTAVPTTDLTGTVDLDSQVSGTLSTAFAEAGLINTNVTINANGTLSGAGGGQASLTSLPGLVQAGSIAANAVTAAEIAALTITSAEIAAATITGAEIAAGTITASNITAGTITATELAINSVTSDQILAGAVTAAKINVSTLSAISANVGTLTSGTITGVSVTATTGAIGGWTLASGSLSSGQVRIESTDERIEMGSGVTGPLTGTGIWMGNDGGTYEFRAGNPSGNYIHWDGTTLTVIGDVNFEDAQVQSFTPSGWTGFTSAPSGDFDYIDLGTHVIMWAPGTRFGTASSSSTAMTMNSGSIPSAIRPIVAAYCPLVLARDNGTTCWAQPFVSTDGSINFNRMAVSGSNVVTTTWTTSGGSKGLQVGSPLIWQKT